MKVQQAKQRFGIIGNSVLLDRSINIALQVAPTDISVFVSGESGTGKENIPKIIPKYTFSDKVRNKILKNKHGDSSGVRGAAWLWNN